MKYNKINVLFYCIAAFILFQLWFHKINVATILQALAWLLQHTLILFYFIAHETKSLIK